MQDEQHYRHREDGCPPRSRPSHHPTSHPFVAELSQLRCNVTFNNILHYDRVLLIRPFLTLITSPDTSGHITSLAIHAVTELIQHGIMKDHYSDRQQDSTLTSNDSNVGPQHQHQHDQTEMDADDDIDDDEDDDDSIDASLRSSSPSPSPAILSSFSLSIPHSLSLLISSLSSCRFEPSDSSSRDEIVLSRILTLSLTLIRQDECRSAMHARHAWQLMSNTYNMYRELSAGAAETGEGGDGSSEYRRSSLGLGSSSSSSQRYSHALVEQARDALIEMVACMAEGFMDEQRTLEEEQRLLVPVNVNSTPHHLSTNQHNELVKKKMTLPQFISNNRGINGGKDVPKEMLAALYYSIKYDEIKMTSAAAGSGSSTGKDVDGYINDALWTDMLAQSRRRWIMVADDDAAHCGDEHSNDASDVSGSASCSRFFEPRRYIRLMDDGGDDDGEDGTDTAARQRESALIHLLQQRSDIIPSALTDMAVHMDAPIPVSLPSSWTTAASSTRPSSSSLSTLLSCFVDYNLLLSFSSSLLSTFCLSFDRILDEESIILHESQMKRMKNEWKALQVERTKWARREERRRRKKRWNGRWMLHHTQSSAATATSPSHVSNTASLASPTPSPAVHPSMASVPVAISSNSEMTLPAPSSSPPEAISSLCTIHSFTIYSK